MVSRTENQQFPHPGNAVQGGTAAAGLDVFFEVRVMEVIEADVVGDGDVDQDVPDDTDPGGEDPPPGGVDRRFRTSEVGRFRDAALVVIADNVQPITALELAIVAERMGTILDHAIAQSFLAEESGELLDAVVVEEIDHDIEPTCGEEAHLLDSVIVLAGVANGVDVIAREFLQGDQRIRDAIFAPVLVEEAMLLDRVLVEVAANGVDIIARDLMSAAERILDATVVPVVTEEGLLLDYAIIVVAANGVDIIARELARGAERALDASSIPTVEEIGLLLDRALVEVVAFDGLDILARELLRGAEDAIPQRGFPRVLERARLHDRVTVEAASFEGVDIIARELMASLEDPLPQRGQPRVRESSRVLDRAAIVSADRNVNVLGRDLIRAVEEASPFRSMGASESGRLLEKVAVMQTERLAVVTARDMAQSVEVINTSVTSVVPQISSATIIIGFPNSEIGAARCGFATGVATQSARVEMQINNGPWFSFQDMDVSPNTAGYLSNWYQGVGGETVRFRVRPFASDGQTGTEGPVFTTTFRTIPGGGGGPV